MAALFGSLLCSLLCSTMGCGAPTTRVDGGTVVAVADGALRQRLHLAAVALVKARKHVATATLVRQLGRARARPLELPGTSGPLRDAVVVLGTLYRCDKCTDWHLGISTGFLISADGACVTSYHVVDRPETETLVAMTAAGTIHPVRAVLAADKLHDVAIIQLAGDGFSALRLGRDPAQGLRVRVLSHPEGHFYSLTDGIVSRSYVREFGKKSADGRDRLGEQPLAKATVVEVTAAFAKGSSGAPVVDDEGAVVGVASNTHSIYYRDDQRAHGVQENLQMVLRRASPVSAVARLLDGR